MLRLVAASVRHGGADVVSIPSPTGRCCDQQTLRATRFGIFQSQSPLQRGGAATRGSVGLGHLQGCVSIPSPTGRCCDSRGAILQSDNNYQRCFRQPTRSHVETGSRVVVCCRKSLQRNDRRSSVVLIRSKVNRHSGLARFVGLATRSLGGLAQLVAPPHLARSSAKVCGWVLGITQDDPLPAAGQ